MNPFQSGDKCAVYFPHDGRHNSLRPGVVVGAGYAPDQRRVQYEDGSTWTVHLTFLYAPGEQPASQRRAPGSGERTQKPGPKPGVPKAPAQRKPTKRGVTGKRRKQVKDILNLAMKRRLETSTTPKKWEGE